MAPSVEKKIAELEMGLLHLQQNIDIPDISLPIHPTVAQVGGMGGCGHLWGSIEECLSILIIIFLRLNAKLISVAKGGGICIHLETDYPIKNFSEMNG